jgi:hypothetical protein
MMATADLVRDTSLRVAATGVTSDGIAELLAVSSGRRVALVAAKQQLSHMQDEDPSSEVVARGIELISEALRVGTWD